METAQAQELVQSNLVPITDANDDSRCIDDRLDIAGQPLDLSKIPAAAKPGGDIGDLMVLLAVKNSLDLPLPSNELLNIVIEAAGGVKNIKFHTDTKAEEQNAGPGMGCGHINRASLDPIDYGLTTEDVDFLKATMRHLLDQGAKQVVLAGPHDAKAVLVVQSNDYSVIPNTEKPMFILQADLAKQRHDKLCDLLAEKLKSVSHETDYDKLRESITENFKLQLEQTRTRLAPDLPVLNAVIPSDGQVSIAAA